MSRKHRRASIALFACCLAGPGCSAQQAAPPETTIPAGVAADVRVTDVVLGGSVGLDKKIRQPKEVFHPEDTVYVSVVTEGTSSNTLLGARWLRGGKVVAETTQEIAPAGSATSEFHISKPGGFEAGEYEVEVLVDGKPVQKRRFAVQ